MKSILIRKILNVRLVLGKIAHQTVSPRALKKHKRLRIPFSYVGQVTLT